MVPDVPFLPLGVCNNLCYNAPTAQNAEREGYKMQYQDDRTAGQKVTHPIIVMGTDRCLSGWGAAHGGPSYAGWACTIDDADAVERWVRERRDLSRVRIVSGDYRPPSGAGHCHIYVVHAEHPARRW